MINEGINPAYLSATIGDIIASNNILALTSPQAQAALTSAGFGSMPDVFAPPIMQQQANEQSVFASEEVQQAVAKLQAAMQGLPNTVISEYDSPSPIAQNTSQERGGRY